MRVRRSKYPSKVIFAGALLLPLIAMAQADRIQLELGKCAAITDINARVACYDIVAHSQQGKPATPATVVARTESPAQPQAKPEPHDKGEEALLAKVTSLREIQPSKLRITLENGQVWQQTVGKAFLIRANDTVRISSSGWGRSSRLAIDGHPGYIQVSRLQ
jgi:hypothetical protein